MCSMIQFFCERPVIALIKFIIVLKSGSVATIYGQVLVINSFAYISCVVSLFCAEFIILNSKLK